MTATQAHALTCAQTMQTYDEVEALGNFAALMDLYSWAPGVGEWERRGLERRAERYRLLQLVALAGLAALENEKD